VVREQPSKVSRLSLVACVGAEFEWDVSERVEFAPQVVVVGRKTQRLGAQMRDGSKTIY
jgi:hypothetical protein